MPAVWNKGNLRESTVRVKVTMLPFAVRCFDNGSAQKADSPTLKLRYLVLWALSPLLNSWFDVNTPSFLFLKFFSVIHFFSKASHS